MRCSKCGTDNREGRKFCAQCGAPLKPECPSCGAENEPGEKFCGDCGAATAMSFSAYHRKKVSRSRSLRAHLASIRRGLCGLLLFEATCPALPVCLGGDRPSPSAI